MKARHRISWNPTVSYEELAGNSGDKKQNRVTRYQSAKLAYKWREELSYSIQCCNWSQPLFKYCSISACSCLPNHEPFLFKPPSLKAGHQREVLSVTSLTPTLLPPTSLSSHFTPLLLSMTRVHLPRCLSKLSIPHSSLPDKKLIYSSQENENWNNKKNTLTPATFPKSTLPVCQRGL